MMKLIKEVAGVALILFLLVIIVLCSSCKTRKVITDKSEVTKSTTTDQQSAIQKSDRSKLVDTTKRVKELSTEAKNATSSDTEFKADSAVTTTQADGSTKTKFYINGGTVKNHSQNTGSKTTTKKTTEQKGISQTIVNKIDSIGKKHEEVKTDSAAQHKTVDAKSSSTAWALYIPIAGVIIACFGLFLAYRYFKK